MHRVFSIKYFEVPHIFLQNKKNLRDLHDHRPASGMTTSSSTKYLELKVTLPETNSNSSHPENGWLEDHCFLLRPSLFSGPFAVSFMEGRSDVQPRFECVLKNGLRGPHFRK